MDYEKEYKILRKKWLDLNVAFENVDAERCWLRERLAEMHQNASRILDIPRHYEAQNNKYTPSDMALEAVFAGPVLSMNNVNTSSSEPSLTYTWKTEGK